MLDKITVCCEINWKQPRLRLFHNCHITKCIPVLILSSFSESCYQSYTIAYTVVILCMSSLSCLNHDVGKKDQRISWKTIKNKHWVCKQTHQSFALQISLKLYWLMWSQHQFSNFIKIYQHRYFNDVEVVACMFKNFKYGASVSVPMWRNDKA